MLLSATSDLVRLMAVWVRRADAGLARAAAANAASGAAEPYQRGREAARVLEDLSRRFATRP